MNYDTHSVIIASYGVLFSAELNDFISRLDMRYDEKVKKDGVTIAKKSRKLGLISTCAPPPDAPDWTIDQEWKSEHCTIMLVYLMQRSMW